MDLLSNQEHLQKQQKIHSNPSNQGPEGLKTMLFVQQIIGCPLLDNKQSRESLSNILFRLVIKNDYGYQN